MSKPLTVKALKAQQEAAAPKPKPKAAPKAATPTKFKVRKSTAPELPDPVQDNLPDNLSPADFAAYQAPLFDIAYATANPEAELAARELARRRLLPFIQRFRPSYDAGWVHADICRRLEKFVEDIEAKKSPRLLLMMPVRHGKSEICSRHFPPWILGKHPEWEIIAASGAQNLAMSFSRYARDVIRDPGYAAVFPNTKLDSSSQSVENWNILKGGGYLSAGIGTMITGRGATCLPLTECVVTSDGVKSLYTLINDSENAHYVLSYVHGKLEYRKINAFITRETDHHYRVTLSDGTSFDATGEHPVCVDCSGPRPVFRRVDELRSGESVVTFGRYAADAATQAAAGMPRVQDPLHEVAIEAAGSGRYVQDANAHMLCDVHGGYEDVSAHGRPFVRRVWETVQSWSSRARSQIGSWGQASLLFLRMQRKGSVAYTSRGEAPQLQPRGNDVHSLREKVSADRGCCEKVSNDETVLQPRVLRDVVGWQSYPEGYGSRWAKVLPSRVQGNAQKTTGSERSVCSVHVSGQGLASQGRERGEQRSGELGASVSPLPHPTPRRAKASTIESIERIDGAVTVGDLEVEGSHNFVIASGNLLLNCLIIDDPVKDGSAADSPTVRENTWEWYMSTAYTRLAPGGGVLGILTWWNEDDWAGRIQQVMATGDGDMFEIVKYPAINEFGDEYILPNDTIEQFPAPGLPPEGSRLLRKHNTALHPQRYPYDELLKKKANYCALGQKRWWDALFQQNPTPDDGDYFTPDMFRYYSTAPDKRELYIYQAWDFAISTDQKNDYTVGTTVGVDHRGSVYVLDVRRFKSSDGIIISNTILDYAKEYDPTLIGFEDGQIWRTLEAQFKRACDEARTWPSFEVLKPLTDKLVRASPLRGQMQASRVYFDKNAHWFSELYKEFLRFGAGGVHDDMVDSLSWCIRLTLSRLAPREKRFEPKLKSWKDDLSRYMQGASGSHMSA